MAVGIVIGSVIGRVGVNIDDAARRHAAVIGVDAAIREADSLDAGIAAQAPYDLAQLVGLGHVLLARSRLAAAVVFD